MNLHSQISTLFTAILILLLQCSLDANHVRCPLGFLLAQNKKGDNPICYRLKVPETFADTFKTCTGNLYTSRLYDDLIISNHTDLVLWTEYQSAYVGGPFIDASFTETAGSLLMSSFDLNNTQRGVEDKICLARIPLGNYTTEKCDSMYYRYCFVKPYPEDDKSLETCEDMEGSIKFWSPFPICLAALNPKGLRIWNDPRNKATWNQAEKFCKSKMEGAKMLYHGWRYTNNPKLRQITSHFHEFPLHIKHSNARNETYESIADHTANYTRQNSLKKMTYGALIDNHWKTVNRSYVFHDVICEKELALEEVTLTISPFTLHKVLILTTNRKIDVKDDITCFTDSIEFYPLPVTVRKDKVTNRYIIIPRYSGYYWCITKNPSRYLPSESNKLLWIRDPYFKVVHAIKIKVKNKYTLDNMKAVKSAWQTTLNHHLKYEIVYAILPMQMTIREVYLEGLEALLHAELDPSVKPMPLGELLDDSFTIEYMRPVRYCSVDGLLFEYQLKHECKIYSCTGDYIKGKEPIFISNDTEDENCTARESTEVDERTTPSMSGGKLATVRKEPDKQLQQEMNFLEGLLEKRAVPIAYIRELLEKVDDLFTIDENLEIPGRLLHLLDRVGNEMEVKGTESVREVRNNVALVAVNSNPNMPVVGLRIAVRENDNFSIEAFQIIRNEIDSSQLLSNASEAVVRLPGSVANLTKRVSFVVFRNNRAFRDNKTFLNSRVISINVENTTQFENGEMISIYLTPFRIELNRDQSRSCGYWKIVNDTFGYWSQEGCEFIPASTPDTLDTCLCTHLTHFAEILVPRTVFSELNEKILELLSVTGCCLSIIGLAMVGITALLFRSWRKDFRNKIWLQLCIAIFILMLCFFIAVFVQFKTYKVGCMLLGIILHYSVLASFCWMLVVAVLSYKRLVMVFNRDVSHKLLKASVFCWGFPIVVVGILLASAPDSYKHQFEDITPTGNFCYSSGLGLWLAVYAPIAVVLFANWTLFVVILRSVFGSSGIERHGNTNEAFRCASVSCLLVFLFGLPWLFGLFATNVVGVILKSN